MKKTNLVLVFFMFCFILSGNMVYADVIWEPQDDFYEKNSEACVYVNRGYIVNGYEGETIVYKNPLSDQKVMTLKNGDAYNISFTYTDKKQNIWGVIDDYNGQTGWVPMAYMYPIYDGISFMDDYKDYIKKESGTLENIKTGDTIYLWHYPGSKESWDMSIGENLPEYYSVFEDENGHRWGLVNYYYGSKGSWICLDDPSNENLPIRQINTNMPDPPKNIDRVASTHTIILLVTLVMGVIFVTTAIIWLFYLRKNKNKKKQKTEI